MLFGCDGYKRTNLDDDEEAQGAWTTLMEQRDAGFAFTAGAAHSGGGVVGYHACTDTGIELVTSHGRRSPRRAD